MRFLLFCTIAMLNFQVINAQVILQNATTVNPVPPTTTDPPLLFPFNNSSTLKLLFKPQNYNHSGNGGLWYEETIGNGIPNTVISLGHNRDNSAPGKGGIRIGLESNYKPFDDPNAPRWAEFHVEELMNDGTTFRIISFEGEKEVKKGRIAYRSDVQSFFDASGRQTLGLSPGNFKASLVDGAEFKFTNFYDDTNPLYSALAIGVSNVDKQVKLTTFGVDRLVLNTPVVTTTGYYRNSNPYGGYNLSTQHLVIEGGGGTAKLVFAPNHNSANNSGLNNSGIMMDQAYGSISLNSPYGFGNSSNNGVSLNLDTRGGIAPLRIFTNSGATVNLGLSQDKDGDVGINIPGSLNGEASEKLEVNGNIKAAGGFMIKSGAANPTTADIPLNSFIVWKNTTLNELRVWGNDNGVLKSTLLLPPSP